LGRLPPFPTLRRPRLGRRPPFLFLLSRSSGLLYLRRAAGAACSSRASRAASCLAAVDCPRGRRNLVRAAENIDNGVARHGRGELEHHRLAVAEYDHPQDHGRAGCWLGASARKSNRDHREAWAMRVLSRLSRGTMIDVTKPLRATSAPSETAG
jgi:hypothetical protein